MDRVIVYPSSIPLETDLLTTNKSAMVGIGSVLSALFDNPVKFRGLQVTAQNPATFAVNVGVGAMYAQVTTDPTPYSTLPADLSSTFKQAVLAEPQAVTLVPPDNVGQSITYLIQAQLEEQDLQPEILPYFNSMNPLEAFAGPANDGLPQPTVRSTVIVLSAKAGDPASTGMQTAPGPDAGCAPLAYVTLNYGDGGILGSAITPIPASLAAPYVVHSLDALAAGVPVSQPVSGGSGFSTLVTLTSTAQAAWTVPAGVSKIKVRAWGAGAQGDGSIFNASMSLNGGAGGGAGGYIEFYLPVTPGTTLNYKVGLGGYSTTAQGTSIPGADGGDTTFDGFIARGGHTPSSSSGGSSAHSSYGGLGGGAQAVFGGISMPNIAPAGALSIIGGYGANSSNNGVFAGTNNIGYTMIPGYGGSAPMGGQGGSPRSAADNLTTPVNAQGGYPGGGGGGSLVPVGTMNTALMGGAGADGLILIEY